MKKLPDKEKVVNGIVEAKAVMEVARVDKGRCLVFAALLKKKHRNQITCWYNSDHILVQFGWHYLFDENGIVASTPEDSFQKVPLPEGYLGVEKFGQSHFENAFEDCLIDPKYFSWMFGNIVLKELRVGDLFQFEGKSYIPLAFTEDGFEIYCLNMGNHQIEEIYENTEVLFSPEDTFLYCNREGVKGADLDTRL